MTTTPKAPVSEIADAISGRGRLGHSPLYWWMWDHFAELQKERQGRADWVSVTEALSKLGFTNRDKTPLKRENVRKTWERVVRDREKRAALTAKPPKPAPRPTPRPVSQSTPQPTPTSTSAPSPTKDGGLSEVLRAMDANKGQMPKPFK